MANADAARPDSAQSTREKISRAAAFAAQLRHDRCDTLDRQAGTSDVSGDEIIYCGTCGQVLLRWGGDDAE
jgi:hypothetical protein